LFYTLRNRRDGGLLDGHDQPVWDVFEATGIEPRVLDRYEAQATAAVAEGAGAQDIRTPRRR